jgi:UDP-2-acetamido-2,6-beta-L-arabino-hexul-4-ose reductase
VKTIFVSSSSAARTFTKRETRARTMKKVLVTGSSGFIGRNLVECLRRIPEYTVMEFDADDTLDTLGLLLSEADVVFHLAGVNRPTHDEEFLAGNAGLTMHIVARLVRQTNKPMLVLASSIQASLDNPYGRSKRQAEEAVEDYGDVGGESVILRLPNVFGKWSRPNYNSVVATFCHNITRGLGVTINDPESVVELIYIDDVVSALVGLIESTGFVGTRRVTACPVTSITLEALVRELYRIRDIRAYHLLPDMDDRFRRALYATYLSFLPVTEFSYELPKKGDERGDLAEFLKSPQFGQIFVSRTKPGYVRGNHFHDTKIEKFCVLAGKAVIRFRRIGEDQVLTYPVTGTEFRVVDIPPGYTHSIENTGEEALVVLFWSSEAFTPETADTHPLPVQV